MRSFANRRSGLTLVELIVAFSIMMILSTMALPLARMKVQREKERRLREALHTVRTAIDRYKDMADEGKLGQLDPESHGYPPSLEVLVEGVEVTMGGAGMGGPMGGQGFGSPAGGPQGRQRRGRGGSSFGQGGSFGQQGSSFGQGGSSFGQGGSSFGGNRGGRSQGFGSQRSSGFGSQRDSGFGSNRSGFGSNSRSGGSDDPLDSEPEKIRFLRKIPEDPMTGMADWGLRSVQDDPDSYSWGGQNVFDVYSKSMDQALDGTYYRDW